MAGTFCNVKLHIVFSTKHRSRSITPELQPRLYEYIGGVIRGMNGVSLEIGGMPDHVHLLVGWRTDEDIAVLVREIKSESSKWVHEEFPARRDFRWQSGYGVFSVSQSQVQRVREYIQRQVEHHTRETFEEEFIRLLKAHEIDYDERYVFD